MRGSAVDARVVAAPTATLDCRFAGVELADPERLVGSLPAEFGAVCDWPRGACGVAAAAVATAVSGGAASPATSDGTCLAEDPGAADDLVGNAAAGDSAGAAVATAEGTPGGAGLALADAVASRLDGVEPVCAPPELCTTPDDEPAEAPAADADEPVDEAGPVDAVPATDSELEADDDGDAEEPADEPEDPASAGSANATPGVFATTAPTPSATAKTPARVALRYRLLITRSCPLRRSGGPEEIGRAHV